MTEQNTCPDPQMLERMLLGKLTQAEITAMDEHLQSCRRCAQSAATIEVKDELTDTIRAGKPWKSSEVEDGLLARIIERGKELGSRLQTVQIEETQAVMNPLEGAKPAVDSFASGNLDNLDFLAPAQQPR